MFVLGIRQMIDRQGIVKTSFGFGPVHLGARCRGRSNGWIVMVLTVLVLAGCSTGAEDSSAVSIAKSPPQESSAAEVSPELGQQLPVEAYIRWGDRTLELEVAQTPEQQAMGLMFREELPDDRGMLFPFNPPRPVRFWMKNVRMDLDMIFIYEGEVVGLSEEVPPCETVAHRCPTYGPGDRVLVDAVLELRGGRAAELGIEVGDRLEVIREL